MQLQYPNFFIQHAKIKRLNVCKQMFSRNLKQLFFQNNYYWAIGLMSRVFANILRDQASIPGRVIPKTKKMVLDATLLNTQHYKVQIKGKMEQSREWSSALPYTSV